jgi:hypothetical protein
MKYPRLLCRVFTLLSILTCTVPMLLAKEETTKSRQQETVYIENPRPTIQQATTTPFSNTTITLRISADGHEPVTLTQHEGGLIRIERLPSEEGESGVIVGFTPYVSDLATETVSVKATRITRIIRGGVTIGEGIKELDAIPVEREFAKDFSPSPDVNFVFSLQLISVKRTTPEKRVAFITSPTPQFLDGGGNCCIICHGINYCGCNVATSCGNCCMGDCCN